MKHLAVDPIRCHAHGLCREILPELVELDEWGYPIIDPEVPRELERAARQAVRSCPTLAMRLGRAPAPTMATPAADGPRRAR
jgi:ferredoxin